MLNRPRRHLNAAFTLVELLIVIAIIAILIGLAFVGARSYIASQRANSTRQTLGNLKAMLGELENANSLKGQPAFWLWWNAGALVTDPKTTAGAAYSPDFWKLPLYLNNTVPIPPATGYAPLVGPSDVTGDGGTDAVNNQRFASIAVINTMLAMVHIASVPANKSRLQSLPASVAVTLEIPQAFTSGEVQQAGPDNWIGWGTDSQPNVSFVPGIHVKKKDTNGKLISYVANSVSTSAPPAANWTDETAFGTGVPILLDAWGNPIIFVPATGLTVLLKNGQSDYNGMDTQKFIIVSSEGQVSGNGTANPVVTRPGRPFWASAGPDGDFSKGDDNVYSFEQ